MELLLTPSLTHACILATCTDPCLHPGEHHKDRIHLNVDDDHNGDVVVGGSGVTTKNKGKKGGGDAAAAGGGNKKKSSAPPLLLFGTWLALGSEFVTIGKYKGNTLVFVPSRDTFFFASPSALLSQECPDGTVLVGQFIIDRDETPRVLVFDVAKLQGVSFNDMPPRERYACLQRLAGCLGPVCTLQWVGECRVLASELQSGRFKVPHAVKGVMALTQTPGRMVMAVVV